MTRTSSFLVVGTVCDHEIRESKYGKPYCRITIELDEGYESLYIHDPKILQTACELEIGQAIRATGTLQPRLGKEREPLFLNPSAIVVVSNPD